MSTDIPNLLKQVVKSWSVFSREITLLGLKGINFHFKFTLKNASLRLPNKFFRLGCHLLGAAMQTPSLKALASYTMNICQQPLSPVLVLVAGYELSPPQLPPRMSCCEPEIVPGHPAQLCLFSLVSGRWKSSHFMLWFPLSDTVEIAMGLHESFPRTGMGVSWKLDLTSVQIWPACPQKCCGHLWRFAEPLKTVHINFGCMAKIM